MNSKEFLQQMSALESEFNAVQIEAQRTQRARAAALTGRVCWVQHDLIVVRGPNKKAVRKDWRPDVRDEDIIQFIEAGTPCVRLDLTQTRTHGHKECCDYAELDLHGHPRNPFFTNLPGEGPSASVVEDTRPDALFDACPDFGIGF